MTLPRRGFPITVHAADI